MSNAIYYVSYPLKKEASVPDFLLSAEKLNNEFISKQRGFITWEQAQAVDGDTWADFAVFETMDDLKNFKDVSNNPSELAEKFYSFMNLSPKLCKHHIFSVEQSMGVGHAVESNAIFFNSYKLKKGVSIPDFMLAVENLVKHTSKTQGCKSFKLLRDGDTWADYSVYETMEDAKNFAEAGGPTELAEHFYSFLNFNSCITRFYSVERKY